jgi:hypothetical protein
MLPRNEIDGVKIDDSPPILSSLLAPAPHVMRSARIINSFQNAVRTELGVSGHTKSWDNVEYGRKHEDAQRQGELGRGVTDPELPD